MENKETLANPQPASPTLQVDLMERFLENQSRELAIRSQEIALQGQQDKNNFEYSQEALRLQAQDRREHRQVISDMGKHRGWFVVSVVMAIILLLGYALHQKESAFAMEVIKAIMFIATGGMGGYGYAKSRSKDQKSGASESD